MPLTESDLVEQPICAGAVGGEFRAIGEEDAAGKVVAMPILRPGELSQVVGRDRSVALHWWSPFRHEPHVARAGLAVAETGVCKAQ